MSEVILKVKISTKDPNEKLPNTGKYWANDLLFTLEELFDNSELKGQINVSVEHIPLNFKRDYSKNLVK